VATNDTRSRGRFVCVYASSHVTTNWLALLITNMHSIQVAHDVIVQFRALSALLCSALRCGCSYVCRRHVEVMALVLQTAVSHNIDFGFSLRTSLNVAAQVYEPSARLTKQPETCWRPIVLLDRSHNAEVSTRRASRRRAWHSRWDSKCWSLICCFVYTRLFGQV